MANWKPPKNDNTPFTSMSNRLKETLGIVGDMQDKTDLEIIDVEAIKEEINEHLDEHGKVKKNFQLQQINTNLIDVEKSDVKMDYVFARNMHYTLTETLGEAIEEAFTLAKETQHPKMFDTTNELAKTMLEVQKSMMSIQKVYKDVTEESIQRANTINNVQINTGANTVISTDDVYDMIDNSKKTKIIDVESN